MSRQNEAVVAACCGHAARAEEAERPIPSAKLSVGVPCGRADRPPRCQGEAVAHSPHPVRPAGGADLTIKLAQPSLTPRAPAGLPAGPRRSHSQPSAGLPLSLPPLRTFPIGPHATHTPFPGVPRPASVAAWQHGGGGLDLTDGPPSVPSLVWGLSRAK